MSLGIAAVGLQAKAGAENVDSELVLLVDITTRGLNNTEFDLVMEGYASAFTSSQVLDSIQSGAYGKIAVSLMFYGNSSTQIVGIPWMMIGSATEAQQFAALARGVNAPSSPGPASVESALAAAALSFGSETGGTANGFESNAQIIEIAAATVPANGSGAAVAAASNNALVSGVDLINSIALGNRAATIEAYYASYVIGGEAGGVVATSSSSPINGALGGLLTTQVSGGVTAGAAESLTAIPEPSSSLALLSGLALLLIRRRKH